MTICCPGELQSVDGYMNIALEKTEEYVQGTKRRTYGDAFVRGNNGQYFVYLSSHTHANDVSSNVYLWGLTVATYMERWEEFAESMEASDELAAWCTIITLHPEAEVL